nr:hypothetical protein [Oenococcus oeni]
MSRYFLMQQHNTNQRENRAYNKDFSIAFNISGKIGSKNDVLYVYDTQGVEQSRIRQVSYGILPRFQLLYQDKYVGSIGFNFAGFNDVIFVRYLNWVITGEIVSGKYRIRHGRKKLLEVNPVEFPDGLFYQLDVQNDAQASVHVAIAALLDRWGMKKNRSLLKLPTRSTKYKYKMATRINQ